MDRGRVSPAGWALAVRRDEVGAGWVASTACSDCLGAMLRGPLLAGECSAQKAYGLLCGMWEWWDHITCLRAARLGVGAAVAGKRSVGGRAVDLWALGVASRCGQVDAVGRARPQHTS